jgi:hypothetical protein
MRRASIILVSVLCLAGCGDDVPDRPVDRGTPAVTTGGMAYENGGADGSGADGRESPNARGGIAGGPDDKSPDEAAGSDAGAPPSQGSTGE